MLILIKYICKKVFKAFVLVRILAISLSMIMIVIIIVIITYKIITLLAIAFFSRQNFCFMRYFAIFNQDFHFIHSYE